MTQFVGFISVVSVTEPMVKFGGILKYHER